MDSSIRFAPEFFQRFHFLRLFPESFHPDLAKLSDKGKEVLNDILTIHYRHHPMVANIVNMARQPEYHLDLTTMSLLLTQCLLQENKDLKDQLLEYLMNNPNPPIVGRPKEL